MAGMNAAKVTLSTGKVVILREMRISDTEKAAQECAPRAGGDPMVLNVMMQKALLKNMLLQVDGKDITGPDREDLDGLFKMSEYTQLMKVVQTMSGGDDVGKVLPIESVSFGNK